MQNILKYADDLLKQLHLSSQVTMGQNQEKMDGGEQVPAEGAAEVGSSSERRVEKGDHPGDVLEGRSSHEMEEEGQEKQEEEARNTRHDSRGSGIVNEEPITPCSQEKMWVRPFSANEVRSAGQRKEVLEGGAAGEQANQLALHSHPRMEETDAAFKSRHQSIREEKNLEEQPRRRLRSRMKEVALEQEVHEDGTVFGKRVAENSDTTEDLVRRRRQAAQRGVDTSAGRDSNPQAGTLGLFTDRKELLPTTTPHPFKNSLQKESQSELKDSVHSGVPSQRNLNFTEEETLKLLLNDCNPTRLEAVRLRLHMEAAGGTTACVLGSGQPPSGLSSSGVPGSETPGTGLTAPSEPSSILEKLLQRNKNQMSAANMEIQDVHLNPLCNGAAPEVPPGRTDPSITPLANYGTSSKDESHGPSTTPEQRFLQADDGQIRNPHYLPSSPDRGSGPLQPGTSSETGTCSTDSEDQTRRSSPKEHLGIVDQVEKDPALTHRGEDPLLAPQGGDLEPAEVRANEESNDSVKMRDKSHHNRPRSRPVSQLIKESIQLHEKLQQQERARPASEIRSEEQNQSVKVAQMKAAFDTAQKTPEKGVERKPSMRKGKTEVLIHFLSGQYSGTEVSGGVWCIISSCFNTAQSQNYQAKSCIKCPVSIHGDHHEELKVSLSLHNCS